MKQHTTAEGRRGKDFSISYCKHPKSTSRFQVHHQKDVNYILIIIFYLEHA